MSAPTPTHRHSMDTRGAVAVCLGATMLAILALDGCIASSHDDSRARVEPVVTEILRHMSGACPLASPGDQAAFERCRTGLYATSPLAGSLAPVVLWGREGPVGQRLEDT